MFKKRSIVWQYFEIVDKISAKCTLCQHNFRSYGSTGNLINHLKRRHSSIVSINSVVDAEDTHANLGQEESSLASPTESDIDVYETSSSNSHAEDVENTKLNHALVNLIAGSFHPISMINRQGFQGLIHALRPNYSLPSKREFLTQHLPKRYEIARLQLKNLIDQAEYVSMAADVWKLKYRCFVTCYAYCILDSKLHCFLLATEQIPYYYTQKSIVSALSTIAVDWDIDNKIVCFIIHNNPLMISSIKELELPYLPCINYTVRQIVSEVFELPALIELRVTCRTTVNYFKENAVASNKLIELQFLMKQPKMKLLIETPFKWRTTFAMFKRLLQMKDLIRSAMSKQNGSPEPLTDTEWDNLSDCVQLLDPLFSMMKKIRASEYQIAGQIIPLVNIAHELIVSCCPVSLIGSNLKASLITSLEKTLVVYNDLKLSVHSTLLHPQLKNDYDFTEDSRASLVKDLLTEYEKISTAQTEDNRSHNMYLDNQSKNEAQHDYEQFSKMAPVLEENSNPFLFWEEMRKSYPILAKLALKYMCVPAHLLDAQRLFSKHDLVRMLSISNLRAKKNINKIIFLHAFLKYEGYDFE